MEGQSDDGWVPVGQARGCAWRERARGQQTTNLPVGSGNAETATASALGRGRSAPAPGSATAPGGSAVAGQFAAAPEPVAVEPVASVWGTSAPSGEGGVRGAAQSASVASQPQGIEVPVSEPKCLQPSFPPSGAPVQGRGFEATAPTQPRKVGGIATGQYAVQVQAVARALASAVAEAVPEGTAHAAVAVPAGAAFEEPAPSDNVSDIPEGYSRFEKRNMYSGYLRSAYETGRGHRVATFRNPDFQPSPVTDKSLLCVYGNSFSLMRAGPAEGFIHQYHCFSSPEIDNVRLRKAVIMAIDHVPVHAIFDGCSLFVREILPQGVKFRVTLKLKKKGQAGEGDTFNLFLKKVSSFPVTSPQSLVVYNLMFKKAMRRIGLKEINHSFFDPRLKQVVDGCGLEVLPGFNTAIAKHGTGELVLQVNMVSKVLRQTSLLQDIREEIRQTSAFSEYSRRHGLLKKLLGKIVISVYNYQTYTIDDIAWDENPTSEFATRNGRISYVDYYKDHYKIQIRDLQQPLLIARLKGVGKKFHDPLRLVPELVHLTGLDDDMRKDLRMMQALASYTNVPPQVRAFKTSEFIAHLYSNKRAKQVLEAWKLVFSDQPVRINGRMLNQPFLLIPKGPQHLRGDHSFDKRRIANGAFDVKNTPAIVTTPLTSVLIVASRTHQGEMRNFWECLKRVSVDLGMQIDCVPSLLEIADRPSEWQRALQEGVHPETQLVICVIANSNTTRYNTIKQICCIQRPVPSQCVLLKNIRNEKRVMSVAAKIAVQVNCKIGGVPWMLRLPGDERVSEAMTIGIDVNHFPNGQYSCVGFVATINDSHTRFFVAAKKQYRHEFCDTLELMTEEAVAAYRNERGRDPKYLYIFRDGVGDEQLERLRAYELDQIRRGLDRVKCKAKLTLICVKRRVDQRFWMQNPSGRVVNVPLGLVVDSVVTRPEWYDFFLVSQTTRHGTVSPTHFNVIHDESGLEPHKMQYFTNALHYMYFNWQGSIRVPAPCQYARKLAFLVSQNLGQEPSKLLGKRLYFLWAVALPADIGSALCNRSLSWSAFFSQIWIRQLICSTSQW